MQMHTQLKRALVAAIAVVVMAFPVTAMAQQSSQDAYQPRGQIEDVGGDQGGVGGSPGAGGGAGGENANATTSGNAGSGLPFTGMDVALLAGAGALLLGAGVGMRRVAHRHHLA
jgi:hypothetical protein